MTPASRCSGDGSAGHARRDQRPGAIDHVDGQPVLNADVPFGADAPEKSKRLVVAAEEDVLPVVHALAGCRIGERGGAPAQRRPRLDDKHLCAALGQRGGGAQARKAAADDDDVGGQRCTRVRAQIRKRDERAVGTRHADSAAEHVVARPLDAPQDAEIDAAHDFGGDQAPRIGRREARRRRRR